MNNNKFLNESMFFIAILSLLIIVSNLGCNFR